MFKMIEKEAVKEEAIFGERWTRIVERTIIIIAVCVSCELFQPGGMFDRPANVAVNSGTSFERGLLASAMQQSVQPAANSTSSLAGTALAMR